MNQSKNLPLKIEFYWKTNIQDKKLTKDERTALEASLVEIINRYVINQGSVEKEGKL